MFVRATLSIDWPKGTRFRLHAFGETYDARTRLVGRVMIYPILAAITASFIEGLPPDKILPALEKLPPTPAGLSRFNFRMVHLFCVMTLSRRWKPLMKRSIYFQKYQQSDVSSSLAKCQNLREARDQSTEISGSVLRRRPPVPSSSAEISSVMQQERGMVDFHRLH